MCAKVSASVARAGIVRNRTSGGNGDKTPSKLPTGRRTGPTQRDTSNESSDEEEEEEQEQSGSDSGSDSTDFLGQPPTTVQSESNRNSSNETSGNQESPQRHSTNQRAKTGRRKQSKPTKNKKRKDQVTKQLLKLQSTVHNLIPRLPFQRCVREILQEANNEMRLQSTTLDCLQEASEQYLTQLFEDSYLCCLHRSRVTLTDKDLRLVHILRGPLDSGRR